MSQDNVEIVRRFVDAFQAGRRDDVVASLDDNVVWIMPPIDAGVSHGVEATERAVVTWLSAWEDYSMEVVELVEAGERVLGVFRQRGRAKAGGPEVDLTSACAFSLRASKIVRMEVFGTKQQALEAVGLSE